MGHSGSVQSSSDQGGDDTAMHRNADRDRDNLQVVREAGDGDCLFHALARQCLGDTALASRLRNEVCNWMEKHMLPSNVHNGRSDISAAHREEIHKTMSDILNIYGEDREASRYFQRMRKPGAWGSGLEALAAAYAFSRPVLIWQGQASVSRGPPLSTITPPGCDGNAAVGLVHVGGNHWNSVLIPADRVSPSGNGVTAVAPTVRRTAAEAAEDRAFQEEFAAEARIDPSITDAQRQAQRSRVAARYEATQQRAMPKRGVTGATRRWGGTGGKNAASGGQAPPRAAPAPQATGEKAAGVPATAASRSGVVANAGPTATLTTGASRSASTADDLRRRRCTEALMKGGMSEAEAFEAFSACAGDVVEVERLYGIELDVTLGEQGTTQTSDAFADERLEAQRRECALALGRIGMSDHEALMAIEACGGDVEKVKQLYAIDWDSGSQRTVQTLFAGTA